MTLEKKVSLEKWNKLILAHLMLVLIVLWVWLFSTDLSQRGHARLDSMVLLLMKLDQLDQEIENALSATSSMDSTATFHRRHHPVPAQLSYLAGCDSSFFYIWNCAAVQRSQWTILFVFFTCAGVWFRILFSNVTTTHASTCCCCCCCCCFVFRISTSPWSKA